MLLAAIGAYANPIAEADPSAGYGQLTYKGCFASSTGLTLNSTYTFNTNGYCKDQCVALSQTVVGLTAGAECWCGNTYPPKDTLSADDTKCNANCTGYGSEMCGSDDGTYFSVWLDGLKLSATYAEDTSADSSAAASLVSATATSTSSVPSATKTSAPSVVTSGSSVITVTAPAQAASVSAAAESAAAKKSSKSSTAGIVAGVVVGVVLIAAIAGGAFLYLRHKRRREIEDEYQRNASINTFVSNGKPPGSSAGFSNVTDTRLDHTALQRRMSDGSIADNEDYSRKILRVTNA